MKQVDKVIRKGDYYEMQVVDDGILTMKTNKKEQVQPTIIMNSDNIVTNLPTFSDAKSKYYYPVNKRHSSSEPDQLLHQLENILANEKLADQDKQEVLKTIRQIQMLKEEPLVPLIELTPRNNAEEGKEAAKRRQIQLFMALNIKDMEDKVAKLEKFTYPELTSLQHQLQVLLGEKKHSSHSQLPKDERNKQQIDQLYALLSSLTCAENIQNVVDRVHANDIKYSQMAVWSRKMEETTSLHTDFLAELNEDELLLNKLQQNFKSNVETVKQTIAKLKSQAKK